MNRILKAVLVPLAFALALGISSSAFAGDAQTYMQARQTELNTVLHQPKSPARTTRVAALLDAMFDYDKLAHDSLGRNAEGKTDEQIKEFTDLLKQLVRRAYQKNIEKTLDYEIQWVGETGGDDHATLSTTAKSTKPGDSQETISIKYKLHKRDGHWMVGDVITEESSLVNTYRNQFNKTLNKDGWDGLIRKLKNKIATGRT
ncbi:MAG: ABC transporter substrate-binding protein [Deltaproteobacteria bacterium]|nr:ABC transporter substrate-binding protein [Deltaproteobacteria bacterium]